MNFSTNKSFRILNIYERLNRGEELHKDKLANDFGVSLKTVQRDIDELRAYLEQTHFSKADTAIKYDKAKNCYYLIRPEREWMTNEEALALCKILLESRAFCKDELSGLIDKLIAQVSPSDRSVIKGIIKNELFNYVPLRHGKKLLNQIWTLSQYITNQEIISFKYHRQDGKQSIKIVKPLSIMFSEFYFYLIAFMADKSKNYPIIFRIDRITEIKNTGEHFTIDYRNKFKDGEFRKRVQFMYSGELKTVKFEYSGVLEAILDRLPTAKILKEENGVYTISAETYGDGIYMWLRSQGDMVRIL